ncbi:MAG TPA: DUF1080 domain-containing protein [Planctomycetota bacterium]|nr:DUF1080 domain-containing protein [Planctomycetota bacterium]HRR83044.1 DUF1080 domain-containing protein [Planctomycetota bacterium]HRT95789.1 DUF1080 domain-containing protein [Planctomycetota bacterium]
MRTVLAAVALMAGSALAQDAAMGDWQGTWKSANGAQAPLVAQVIALGDGAYQANLLDEFDKRIPALVVLQGKEAEGKVAFSGKAADGKLKGTEWTGTIEGERFTGTIQGTPGGTFEMKKVVRLSPTLGAKPPQGAVVLFDGTCLDEWQTRDGKDSPWKLLPEEKAMEVRGGGVISRKRFGDCKLHLEFRTPFMPKARGQGRGNSGVYLQGRYEVQVLDSYGLSGESNECGGIYGCGRPLVNMCAPPMQWQTYDITFTAPRFDAEGKKIKNATLTVLHNGVLVQDKTEVPNPTAAHWGGDPKEPGGIHLQDHGNPVQYRNIWVVETKGEM